MDIWKIFFQIVVFFQITESTLLGKTLSNLVSSAQQVLPPADNSLVYKAIAAAGIEKAESQISASKQDDLVTRVVSTLVNARLDAHFYTGMCFRNYTDACPSGWAPQEEGLCVRAGEEQEESPRECLSFSSLGATSAKKSDFALKCKAQWPCSACKRDFSNCPTDFVQVDQGIKGNCEPTERYLGPCREPIDFRKVTDSREKPRWASRCYTSWPCLVE